MLTGGRALRQRFTDPALELRFRLERTRAILPLLRGGLIASLFLWPATGLLLPFIGPVNARLDVLVVIAMDGLAVLWLPILWSGPTLQVVETAGVVSVALNGLAVLALALGASSVVSYVAPGLMLVTTYAFVVFQLPPASGMAAALVYVVGYLVTPLPRAPAATVLNVVLISAVVGLGALASYILERATRERFAQQRIIEAQAAEIAAEQAKSDRLLRNVLPARIAAQLRETPEALAEQFESASVLFADIVGFTPLSERLGPQPTAELLNDLVSRFDELAEHFGLEKIKTIGDAYLVVGGVPERTRDHAVRVAHMGLAMVEATAACGASRGLPLAVRIGVHSGPVVAGVIGRSKFAYDVWGDTVNVASRLETSGVPGEMQASEATVGQLDDTFEVLPRGAIELKGKGPMPAFLVRARG